MSEAAYCATSCSTAAEELVSFADLAEWGNTYHMHNALQPNPKNTTALCTENM